MVPVARCRSPSRRDSFLPGSRPTTLCEVIVAALAVDVGASASALSGTGWKSRRFAAAFGLLEIEARRGEDLLGERRAGSSFRTACALAAGFWRTMSNMVLVLEFLTVFQP